MVWYISRAKLAGTVGNAVGLLVTDGGAVDAGAMDEDDDAAVGSFDGLEMSTVGLEVRTVVRGDAAGVTAGAGKTDGLETPTDARALPLDSRGRAGGN